MNWKIAFWILLVVAIIGLFTACVKGPQRAAYVALTGTEITVDSAMQAWGAYVAQFHPPAAQEKQVEDVYQKYQLAEESAIDAMQVVIAAKAAGTDPTAAQQKAADAAAAAAAVLGDLVNLLRQFGVKV